jgi:hypothetical protein
LAAAPERLRAARWNATPDRAWVIVVQLKVKRRLRGLKLTTTKD